MRRTLSMLIVLMMAQVAHAQSAADLERAKASWRAGAVAYTAGEYLPAIQAFEAAYALTPLAPIAFSLAQAHRRQYFVARERTNLERAVMLFRRYVQEVPHGGRSADALDALSQLEPLFAVAPSLEEAAPVEARPTRLMITSEAPEARISVDGAAAVASPAIQEVTPGSHRVVVSAVGFASAERTVTALPGELILSEVPLRELPASLLIATSADAELYVDGTFVGHGGAHSTVALPSGPHVLTLTQRGHRTTQRQVTLKRGESLPLNVELAETFQRKVARALFVVGGVGLAAGGVFGGLSLYHQNNAKDFLRAQKQGDQKPARADDYDADVRARDRMRLATGLSLSIGAVVIVSAIVTHQLDRPSVGETQSRGLRLSGDGFSYRF